MFEDRTDAGHQLAGALQWLLAPGGVVLGVARGGVVVAAPVARALGASLDVVVPRKLGAPGNPELGIGAIAPGVRVLDDDLVRRLGVDPAYLDAEIARQEAEIERRTAAYRGARPAVPLTDRTVVIVDDGIATGVTAMAAVAWARAAGAREVLFAAPVGAQPSIRALEGVADQVVVPSIPPNFAAVGQWYERFDQTSDDEVRAALSEAPA